jgi:putative chitinase
MLDAGSWRRLYPEADEAMVAACAAAAPEVLSRFGIVAGRQRLQFFLAQIGHESQGLAVVEEALGYSARRMMAVWPGRFPTIAATAGLVHNPAGLAERVYGGRLGNDAPGDGWRYRGRGLIQITGKATYREVGERAGIDLVTEPDAASAAATALVVAAAFWDWRGLNPVCDSGDFAAVTRRINGGTTGLAARRRWLSHVAEVLG